MFADLWMTAFTVLPIAAAAGMMRWLATSLDAPAQDE
jgi:hypothetical protein